MTSYELIVHCCPPVFMHYYLLSSELSTPIMPPSRPWLLGLYSQSLSWGTWWSGAGFIISSSEITLLNRDLVINPRTAAPRACCRVGRADRITQQCKLYQAANIYLSKRV